MKTIIRFDVRYFILAAVLFLTEVGIALYIDDDIIRPYFGDYLVVILIYCFLRSFFDIAPLKVALFVLALSFTMETLQFFHFVSLIGLGKSRLANIVLGNSFAWIDLVAYTAGIVTVIMVERLRNL